MLDIDGSIGELAFPPSISPFPRQVLIAPDGTIAYLNSEYDDAALRAALDGMVDSL